MRKIRLLLCCVCAALLYTGCSSSLEGGIVGPAGGYVFHDKGDENDGWRYLECAPTDAGKGSWGEASGLCSAYSYGGYDDWFLPSIDDLELMYKYLRNGATGLDEGTYWSSSWSSSYSYSNSDYSTHYYYTVDFDRSSWNYAKDDSSSSYSHKVRAIRRFK
jgi:hypothetical protein